MVGFDDGTEKNKVLDGIPAEEINADLTGSLDLSAAKRLPENTGLAFQGFGKAGPFEISPEIAEKFFHLPRNPHGRPNSDVVRPWVNARDITQRRRGMYIID